MTTTEKKSDPVTPEDEASADDVSGSSTTENRDEAARPDPTTEARRVSLSVRTLAVAIAFVVLAAGAGVMTWLYLSERGKVDTAAQQAATTQRVEQIALDYAVNAATMNFQDLNAWKGKLVDGTTPSLNEKLSKAANSMQQLLIPLEWNSTAEPLVAKVRSDTNGVCVVDTFVSVMTKTTQAPDSLQSTATYSITIDSNDNWQISDVGGIGAVVGAK
jgi:hypothetical protein